MENEVVKQGDGQTGFSSMAPEAQLEALQQLGNAAVGVANAVGNMISIAVDKEAELQEAAMAATVTGQKNVLGTHESLQKDLLSEFEIAQDGYQKRMADWSEKLEGCTNEKDKELYRTLMQQEQEKHYQGTLKNIHSEYMSNNAVLDSNMEHAKRHHRSILGLFSNLFSR